jgi:hypothetical protein
LEPVGFEVIETCLFVLDPALADNLCDGVIELWGFRRTQRRGPIEQGQVRACQEVAEVGGSKAEGRVNGVHDAQSNARP